MMHRLIFSINSGRSGSKYLCHLLDTAKNVTAFHEPRPQMAGRRISSFPPAKPTWSKKLLHGLVYLKKYQKVIAIRKILSTLSPNQIYAETNHMFIFSFYDVVMNHFRPVDVILLRRYLPKVLKSFIELNLIAQHPSWHASPNSQSAAVQALARDEELDEIDLCIAHLIDAEGRAQRFKRQYPTTRVIEVRLEELNTWENLEKLFLQLDIEPSDHTREVIGKMENPKTALKAIHHGISEEYCFERIMQYMERCKKKGIPLPHLPHLSMV
jgi:hypothetical protein